MATHSSVLAWRIPRTAEPGGLPSMGSHRVRHNWSDLAAAVGNVLYSDVFVQFWASLVAQSIKNLPAVQETWLRSLGQEDPKEQEMATDSSILPWKTLWTEEPSRLQSMGSRRFSNWIHTRTGCFKAVYRSSLVPLDGRCVSEEPIRIGTQDLDLICVSGY